MGRKVNPVGFRIGIVKEWSSRWYAEADYTDNLHEDVAVRKAIRDSYSGSGISRIEIERQPNQIVVIVHTSRPGVIIGRGGQRIEELRRALSSLTTKKVQLEVREIQQPELDAYLVARMIAEQIERRVAYRRAMKQAIFRVMQSGAIGVKVRCSGRLGGAEIARTQVMQQGRVPLNTLRSDIDYGFTEAQTLMGKIGVKVWIYRGDILPQIEEVAAEEATLAAAPVGTSVTSEGPAAHAVEDSDSAMKDGEDVTT